MLFRHDPLAQLNKEIDDLIKEVRRRPMAVRVPVKRPSRLQDYATKIRQRWIAMFSTTGGAV